MFRQVATFGGRQRPSQQESGSSDTHPASATNPAPAPIQPPRPGGVAVIAPALSSAASGQQRARVSSDAATSGCARASVGVGPAVTLQRCPPQ